MKDPWAVGVAVVRCSMLEGCEVIGSAVSPWIVNADNCTVVLYQVFTSGLNILPHYCKFNASVLNCQRIFDTLSGTSDNFKISEVA